ncbi:MAG TPA: hypothetical protein VHJ54_02160 [Solirubrobacterales bacterium]|nr:hypothetical protein [Solirubrobacterales bacterium]
MEGTQELPKPSPEVEQLILLGQIDEATALYSKQAAIDDVTARAVIEGLAES